MNQLENTKTVATVIDGTDISLAVDTKGFVKASIDVVFEPVGSGGDVSNPIASALALQQSDTNGSYADLSGFVGGTDFTVPTPAGEDTVESVRFDVDLRGKKRYLHVDGTKAASGGVAVVVRLGRAEQGPNTAAEKGVDVAVSG